MDHYRFAGNASQQTWKPNRQYTISLQEERRNVYRPVDTKDTLTQRKESAHCNSSPIFRTIIFIVLTLQATCYFSLTRYSRTRPMEMYFSSTAVFLAEALKLLLSLVVIFYQKRHLEDHRSFLVNDLCSRPADTLKLLIPSVLYTVQNNLIYVAMSHLDSTTFQITNQLKILTTAVFSITLLRKRLNKVKWTSLLLLSFGVTMVQVDTHTSVPMDTDTSNRNLRSTDHSLFLGLSAVLAASVVSGFAGVYMEKIFKHRKTSIWILNAQLYTFGVFIGLVGTIYKDGGEIWRKGFFYGYDYIVWFVVLFASAGGILVSMVLKYASCITKGFAASCAIVLSSAVSVYVFGFAPSFLFVVGAIFVITAVLLYSL